MHAPAGHGQRRLHRHPAAQEVVQRPPQAAKAAGAADGVVRSGGRTLDAEAHPEPGVGAVRCGVVRQPVAVDGDPLEARVEGGAQNPWERRVKGG